MNKLLNQILEETRQLTAADNGADYERFVRLVDLRESLTSMLVSDIHLTPQNKQMINEILSYDSIILQHMQKLKDEAKEGLSRIHSFKIQKSGYDTQHSAEGFMYDKRN